LDEHAKRGDGAELLYRASGTASAQNPAFAPDGKSLLLTVFHGGYNKGAAALHVLPLDRQGGIETLLDEHDKAAVNLPGSSWNASTGAITFASDREGVDEVWVTKPGAPPTRVTRHNGSSGYNEPSFSPDGEWIVFQESFEVEGASPRRDELDSIWKVRPDGSGLTRLIDGPATGTDNRQPNWSPRGDRIVFQRRERGSDAWVLFTVAADGTALRRLTTEPGEHTDPSWSPDGRWVVFSSTYGGLELPQVFAISVDGGQPIRVTNNDTTYDGAPSWSPDGKWIAFESYPGGKDRPSSLWRIPAPRL
jgi:TolB protein